MPPTRVRDASRGLDDPAFAQPCQTDGTPAPAERGLQSAAQSRSYILRRIDPSKLIRIDKCTCNRYTPPVKRLKPFWPSEAIRDKLLRKHDVVWTEVEELFRSKMVTLRGEVDVYGERRYLGLGRTAQGRYLMTVYVHAAPGFAKVITAREMSPSHRRLYNRYQGKK